MGLFDSIFDGGHDSLIGKIGGKIQKYTDPIAMIPGVGDKWVDLTSNKIPGWTNQGLSKVMQPFEKIDKTINPVRKIPIVDKVGDAVASRPGDAIGTAVGAFFAAPAIAGAFGGAAGGGAGAAAGGAGGAGGGGFGSALGGIFGGGGGGAGIGSMGATGGAGAYGGGISSTALPGIFPGATVAPEVGGAGIFGGSAGTGSITGAGGVFGGSSTNPWMSAMQNMAQQGMKQGQQGGQKQPTTPLGAAQDQGQQGAYLAPFQPAQVTPTINQQLLAEALRNYGKY